MGKHDEIVLRLINKEYLMDLFFPKIATHYGAIGTWSKYHSIFNNKTFEEVSQGKSTIYLSLYYELDKEQYIENQKKYYILRDAINKYNLNDYPKLFELTTYFEYVLTKGENHYKTTKGYIDLIIVVKPKWNENDECNIFKNMLPIEFIIEIKTEEDFKDIGSILRQIKEYREYYEGGSIKRATNNSAKRYFILLSTKIPIKVKSLFENEDIKCIEIGD